MPFCKTLPARGGHMGGGQGEADVTPSLPKWHPPDNCVFPSGVGSQQTWTGLATSHLQNSTKGSSKTPNAASPRCAKTKIQRESEKGRQDLCLSKDQTVHKGNTAWQRTGSCPQERI